MKKEYAIDKLIENADKCVNMLDLCHRMGIEKVGGEDYREVKNLAKELGLTLKFSYKKQRLPGKTYVKNKEDIFKENSKYTNASGLRKKLILLGFKEEKCECCGLTEWNGLPITLQVHHINGVHTDNRLENLQILCPNCHSQTDTYAGKNANKDNGTTLRKEDTKKSMKKEDWESFKEESWKKNHPGKETLINVFLMCGSFLQTGKYYGVSDNAIKKWFEHYGMPTKKKELKEYIQGGGRAVDGTGLQNQKE